MSCHLAHFSRTVTSNSRQRARKMLQGARKTRALARITCDRANFSREVTTKTFRRATISRTPARKMLQGARTSRDLARRLREVAGSCRESAQVIAGRQFIGRNSSALCLLAFTNDELIEEYQLVRHQGVFM
jgi:hypothetical protein